jgi:hypothetical protein
MQCAIIPVMPGSEPRRPPDKGLLFPVGSSWEKTEVEPGKAAGYRFFPTQPRELMQYASLKRRLDVAAADYLALVVIAWLLQNRWRFPSAASFLSAVGSAFTLRPLFPAFVLHSRVGQFLPSLVFVVAIYCALRHQSRWLDEMVYVFRPPEGFLLRKKVTLTPRQVTITAASHACNFLVALGLVLTAADYLWDLRTMPWLRGSAEIPGVVLSGVLLTVVGFSKSVEAVESDDAEWWQRIIEVAIAAVLSGASFAAVMALGLSRGTEGAIAGVCFGAAMALIAWTARQYVVRPKQRRLPPAVEPSIRRFVFVPLIALGKAIDTVLAAFMKGVVKPLQVVLLAVFKPLLVVLDRILRLFPYRWFPKLKESIHSYLYQPPPPSLLEMTGSFEERGRSPDGKVWGIMHQPQRPPPPSGIVMYVRGSLVRGLLAEESWLTAWLKREPIRPYKGRGGISMWQREDPLDFQRRVQMRVGGWPPEKDLDLLYRRLLSLMIATFVIAYVIELGVGHVVAHFGRPLFEHGAVYATLFGLAVGALFALVSVLGHSSMAALTLGLVSGLSLDPMEGLGQGLQYRLVHDGLLFVVVFVLALLTDTQKKWSQFVIGLLIAGAGVYLQYLPRMG